MELQVPKPLILCIDDDTENLKVRELLLQVAGYETLCAVDGDSGIHIFTNHDVRAVVLDYEMPYQNGAEVARKMRRLKPQVPIVMLSGRSDRPCDVGPEIDSFITKGSGTELLLETITTLLNNRKHPAQYSKLIPRMRKLA